jgi:isopenicillin-N N-acyltransferase-like protein
MVVERADQTSRLTVGTPTLPMIGGGGAGYRSGVMPPLIDVTGTPAECGAAYGTAASALVRQNVELYARRFRDQAGMDQAAVRAAGAAFRTSTQTLFPRVAAQLDGLAEGAGVAPGDLYAINARTELIYGTPPEGPEGACTVVGVLGTHTASGHVLLAQNWDWHPDQREAMVLLTTTDETGHRVLALAEAGMMAKTGLNSAGVGLCVNMLGTDRDGVTAGQTVGVPYHVILRAALEEDNLARALRATVPIPRNAAMNVMLGQAGPEGGEVIDLELVPGDAGWLHPVDGVLTHANHLETVLPLRDTIKDVGGSTLFRGARARRLLSEAAAVRKVSEDDLMALLRDHQSAPSAICRHVDERDAYLDRSETVFAVILDLDERRFGLAEGPPCGHEFSWLDLA